MRLRRAGWIAIFLAVLVLPADAYTDQWEDLMRGAVTAYRAGDYSTAVNKGNAALKEAEKFGPDDQRLATTLNNLAFFYTAQRNYQAAELHYTRSLANYEKTLGRDHPHVASTLNNLARLHRLQGNYDAAEPLYKRSLAILEKTLSREHPHVATILEDYARLLRLAKRETEAVELEQRAMAIRSKHR